VGKSTKTFQLNVAADPLTTTRISGRVLDVDGTPLPGLRVEVGAIQTLTDGQGVISTQASAG
ncbi:MAG: hypothetical protein ACK5T6_07975, partial [Pirellula sp.]